MSDDDDAHVASNCTGEPTRVRECKLAPDTNEVHFYAYVILPTRSSAIDLISTPRSNDGLCINFDEFAEQRFR